MEITIRLNGQTAENIQDQMWQMALEFDSTNCYITSDDLISDVICSKITMIPIILSGCCHLLEVREEFLDELEIRTYHPCSEWTSLNWRDSIHEGAECCSPFRST
jgi:hypothetical protein